MNNFDLLDKKLRELYFYKDNELRGRYINKLKFKDIENMDLKKKRDLFNDLYSDNKIDIYLKKYLFNNNNNNIKLHDFNNDEMILSYLNDIAKINKNIFEDNEWRMYMKNNEEKKYINTIQEYNLSTTEIVLDKVKENLGANDIIKIDYEIKGYEDYNDILYVIIYIKKIDL